MIVVGNMSHVVNSIRKCTEMNDVDFSGSKSYPRCHQTWKQRTH